MRSLILLPLVLLAACEGSNGTTPCYGTVVTTFTGGTWDDGSYVFTLGLNGEAECAFELPDPDCGTTLVTVDGDTLVVEHLAGTSQNPDTVDVRLERDGEVLYEGTITPEWTEAASLGEDAGTCWDTEIAVDLAG